MSDEEYGDEVSDISSMASSDEDDLELLLDQLDERRIKNQNYLGKMVFFALKISY